MIRYGLTLCLICVIASAALAGVNSLTKAKIASQQDSEKTTGLKEVMASGERFEEVKSGQQTLYYKVYNKENSFIGVAFIATGKGYSSSIETMAGMALDGTISCVKVLSQNETPGLGARVSEPSFTRQFTNRNINNLGEVQAITGATISSNAVMNSVHKKAEEIKELLKNDQ